MPASTAITLGSSRRPPFPRKYGTFERWDWDAKTGRTGQYPNRFGFGTAAGFPLFRSGVREKLFLRLFSGPLNPGIEQPREISTFLGEFSPLVGTSYPYRTCRAAPFPESLAPHHNQGCPDAVLQPWVAPNPLRPPTGCGVLLANQVLWSNQSLLSCDGRFTLVMQGDGNLVLYQSGFGALWGSTTVGSGADGAVMQTDGNFVVYRPGAAVWHTSTHGNSGAYLSLQNDGNLVVYQGYTPLWATGTQDATPPPPPPPCPNCDLP